MISINTNLSSIMTQKNFANSTNKMNLAIERLSTGYKINHASDNAANYSISSDMSAQLSSYDIASDNIAMGMDMLDTAQSSLSIMADNASKLRELCMQARNGTYGRNSVNAISQEVNSLISNIDRICNTTKYNDINLFDEHVTGSGFPDYLPTVGDDGFIKSGAHTYDDAEVAEMTKVSEVSSFTSGKTYAIMTKEDLTKLATLVNSGKNTTNVKFVMGADIDLSSIANWTPIGTESNRFKGIFDGNGHTISNLKINNSSSGCNGLFGYSDLGATIKNTGIKNVNIISKGNVGALIGKSLSNVINCFVDGGTVKNNTDDTGGLIGNCEPGSHLEDCYSTVNVENANGNIGGLVGQIRGITILNCFATGEVTSAGERVGGLVGRVSLSDIVNCYSSGNVSSTSNTVGGLIGMLGCSNAKNNETITISNSIAFGQVSGSENVGTFIGGYAAQHTIIGEPTVYTCELNMENCYFERTGNLEFVGAVVQFSGTTAYMDKSTITKIADFDLEKYVGAIQTYEESPLKYGIFLQAGINSGEDSQINVMTNFDYDLSDVLTFGIASDDALNAIDRFLNDLSVKQTELGAAQNRLESALESTITNINNLTSSLSTIRDADIGEVSSDYIRQQILQQACATLISTANQSPAIALQLI